MKSKTFMEIAEEMRNRPTPLQSFISEVAEVTCRSENTVKMWLWGRQVPDDLVKSVLAQHFGVPAETLFPESQQNQ